MLPEDTDLETRPLKPDFLHAQPDLPAEAAARARQEPAVLVVGPQDRVLFGNVSAYRVMHEWNERRRIAEGEHPDPAPDIVPKAIFSLCRDLFQHAKGEMNAKDEKRCAQSRVLWCGDGSLLMRGITVVGAEHQPTGRVVVTLQLMPSGHDANHR